MIAAPFLSVFGADGDEDILKDLAERGVTLSADLAAPLGDSQLDALASSYLADMAECDAEIARYTEARDAELRRITIKYDSLMEQPRSRRIRFEMIVCELANRADFGKKKSREVGNGSYGRRTKPEHVKVLDQEKALEFARKHFPSAVKEKTTYSVEQKSIAPVVMAYIRAHEGEVPDGFDHQAERDEAFAKPELA